MRNRIPHLVSVTSEHRSSNGSRSNLDQQHVVDTNTGHAVLEGRLNLVLVSICLGLLFVGVWLKTRYQMHLRKGPGGH